MATAPLARIGRLAPFIVPLAVVLGARAITHTEWAEANAGWAAALFVWLVADALCLGALSKSPRGRAGLRAFVGALALASVVIVTGAAAPVRAVILSAPPLLAAMALTGVVFLGWNACTVWAARRGGAGWRDALETAIPPVLLRFAVFEARMMGIALLRWNAAPHVPAGALPFAYHRFLVPMLVALMALQTIELGVMHLLLMQWSEQAAWIAAGLSLAGLVWLVGLLKSFRLYPLLLTERGLHVRSGLMVDVFVPFAAIRGIVPPMSGEALKDRAVCNTAILSSPNVTLDLAQPLELEGPLGGTRMVNRVALRLDDSAGFLAALVPKIAR